MEDATVENGCLWMYPGSHHEGGVHRLFKRNPNGDGTIFDKEPVEYDDDKFVPLECKAGDLVLIHGQMVHKSFPNKSDVSRNIYTFHMLEKEAHYSDWNWLKESADVPFVPLFDEQRAA